MHVCMAAHAFILLKATCRRARDKANKYIDAQCHYTAIRLTAMCQNDPAQLIQGLTLRNVFSKSVS